MIQNYEIKQENNEQILYLYFDFNDEFAKLNFKERKQKLEHVIKDFIKNNKIAFHGTKVAIITSGVVIGTLLLNNPTSIKTPKLENNTVTITEHLIDTMIKDAKTNEIMIENNNQEQIEENNEVEDAKIEEGQNDVNIESVKQDNASTFTSVPEQVEPVKEASPPEVQEAKTYVTIHRTNGQVIELELEEYIIGVVGAEMPASFQDQALMSQAIIARTYALKALNRGISLTDNSSTQNYKNNDELRSLWGSDYNFYYNKIKNAVQTTKGLYLTYNGSIIEAVYHSTSNGTTEDSKYVWGNSFPYLVSVESPYDSSNPSFQKEQFLSYQELTTKLGIEINSVTNFNILSKTTGNRVENIEINGNLYTGVQMRNLLGLRSTDFEITKTDTGVNFVTKGYGHGVGLSQYGANGMAKAGYSYEQILKHYYQGVTLTQM